MFRNTFAEEGSIEAQVSSYTDRGQERMREAFRHTSTSF